MSSNSAKIVAANDSLGPSPLSENSGASELSSLPESANGSANGSTNDSANDSANNSANGSANDSAPLEEVASFEDTTTMGGLAEEEEEVEGTPMEELPEEEESSSPNNVEASAPGVELPMNAPLNAPPVKTRKAPKGSTGLTASEIKTRVDELKASMAAKGINPGTAILRQAFFHYMRLKQAGTSESDAIRQRDALIEEKMAEAQQPKKGKCPPLPADLDMDGVKRQLRNDFESFLGDLEKKVSTWLTRKSKRLSPMANVAPAPVRMTRRVSNSRNSVYNALTRARSNNEGKSYYKRPPKNLVKEIRKYRNAHPSHSTKKAVKEYMLAKAIANKRKKSNKRKEKRVTIASAVPRNSAVNMESIGRSNE